MNRLLHGGDYNPEQWLDRPDILEQDIRILKKTGCNTVTLGVFSWSALEPEEGVFDFSCLEKMIDRLYGNGIQVILATPSGARPKWLSDAWSEVLRTDAARVKQLYGTRHNHCYTSPVYREKTARIDRELARRFGRHPAVIMWHISNEFGGECHCPLCQEAFRKWLRTRYGSIEELNRRWWTAFWSHIYQDFDQIESPSPIGENMLHALNLDWKRFVTDQSADFMRHEIRAIRTGSDLPVTTNLMYYFQGLDYFTFVRDLDIVSWDSYPTWHKEDVLETARDNGLWHDMMRSLKRQPFLLMESCPSSTNWQGVSKLKPPGLLEAQSIQAVAHGADGAMYFQIRQSRGASEKFHGAVIDHYGGEDTRVIREVTATGKMLEKLAELAGTVTESRVAILYDWNSLWAMEDSQGPRNDGLHYRELLLDIYHACRDLALDVDLADEGIAGEDLLQYQIVFMPTLYQFRSGFAGKVRDFVNHGGILITTCWSGIADETDLCYLGGTPHDLTDVLGVRSMEIDGLYDHEENRMVPAADKAAGLRDPDDEIRIGSSYRCRYLCDLVSLCGAGTVLVYDDGFYREMPALTVHSFGEGEAWYVASHAQRSLYRDLLADIMRRHDIPGLVAGELPHGLEVTSRVRREDNREERYLIFQNFGKESLTIPLQGKEYEDLAGNAAKPLPVYGTAVVRIPGNGKSRRRLS